MGVVMERWCPTQQMLGVFLMRRLLLAGIAALSVLGASAAEECKPGSPNCICDNEETGNGCYLEHQPPAGSTCALHTSDFKGAWQCGNVCVRRSGNPGDRAFTIDRIIGNRRTGLGDPIAGNDPPFTLTIKGWVATMNGKRCKLLSQTYNYEDEK
jgi:hypothetical protein